MKEFLFWWQNLGTLRTRLASRLKHTPNRIRTILLDDTLAQLANQLDALKAYV